MTDDDPLDILDQLGRDSAPVPVEPQHDPDSLPSRMRAALAAVGWSQRYFAGRMAANESRIHGMCRGTRPVNLLLLGWLEGYAEAVECGPRAAEMYLERQPVPPGWKNTEVSEAAA
jgi:hypothetical protein